MSNYIVTIKLPHRSIHDPKHKKEGMCPLNVGYCSDMTGDHHSTIINTNSIENARKMTKLTYGENVHITRIELVTV